VSGPTLEECQNCGNLPEPGKAWCESCLSACRKASEIERERLTKAFAAFVLDHADQSEDVTLADVAHDIATGEALAKYERGELDDLMPRVEYFQVVEKAVKKRKPL